MLYSKASSSAALKGSLLLSDRAEQPSNTWLITASSVFSTVSLMNVTVMVKFVAFAGERDSNSILVIVQ